LISTFPRAFEEILLAHPLVDGIRDLDLAGDAMTFHAAGKVHGVAPKIIDKFLNANDAGDDRTGVDADAHREGHFGPAAQPRTNF
jgi:hypothetical protein